MLMSIKQMMNLFFKLDCHPAEVRLTSPSMMGGKTFELPFTSTGHVVVDLADIAYKKDSPGVPYPVFAISDVDMDRYYWRCPCCRGQKKAHLWTWPECARAKPVQGVSPPLRFDQCGTKGTPTVSVAPGAAVPEEPRATDQSQAPGVCQRLSGCVEEAKVESAVNDDTTAASAADPSSSQTTSGKETKKENLEKMTKRSRHQQRFNSFTGD